MRVLGAGAARVRVRARVRGALGARHGRGHRRRRAAARRRSRGITVRPWFTPGRGERAVAPRREALGRARRRVRIASPVLTAGPILGTLVRGRLRAAAATSRASSTTRSPTRSSAVARERRQRLEDPAARHDRRSAAVLREAVDAVAPAPSRTSCTRRSRSPTNGRSSAGSTSRARASGTPRTSSRSTDPVTRRPASPPSSTTFEVGTRSRRRPPVRVLAEHAGLRPVRENPDA